MSGQIEKMYFIVSFGGVGTHMLMPMIKESDWLGHVIKNRRIRHMRSPHHIRKPPATFKEYGYHGKVRLIYVFGDPVNSVLSHFRRRITNKKSWCKHHCMNIQGNYKKLSPRWNLEDYLNNGVDLFGLEEHFDNWTGIQLGSIDYDFMILKYETAHRHEKQIMDFLETDTPLAFKKRSSDWRTEREDIKIKLIDMYGSLLAKCEQFDEIKRVQ